MFSIHATKKLLDRVKQPVMPPVPEPTTALLPVLMPLAPAATLMARFPEALRVTL